MLSNIKPLVNIGDKVNIKQGICIQTQYGWNIVHLTRSLKNYEVHDVKVIISLKSGKIEYSYLIGHGDPMSSGHFHGGWVDSRNLEIIIDGEGLAVGL